MTLAVIDSLSEDVSKAATLILIILAAIVANSLIAIGLRLLTRRAVRRALRARGRWQLLLPRVPDDAGLEQRRVQRADAAAHMFARLSSVLVAAVAAIACSHVLDIDPLLLVSSAGFVGAGIAIGGQALIKDWLTGLLVLLEDRYAVGDQITIWVGGTEFAGTVETLSGAGVRLRLDDGTTWHAGHGSVESVINRSQQLVVHQIDVPTDVWAELDETMIGPDLHAASHDLGLTGVLILPNVDAQAGDDGTTRVTVRANRKLTDRQRQVVADRITRRASERPNPEG